MINIIREFDNKYPFLKWVLAFIIIGVPLIIAILISLIPFGIGDDISWLSFWGVWLSAIIGSSVSIIGIYFTLEYSEEQFKKTMNSNRAQYEEDRIISLMPHIKISIPVAPLDCGTIYFNNIAEGGLNYSQPQRNDIKIRLRNIGIGSALGVKFKIGGYLGTVPFEENASIFDIGVNEIEDTTFSLFDMVEKSYDLELEYTDILERHTYKQKGTIYIKSTYTATIIMSPIKSQY